MAPTEASILSNFLLPPAPLQQVLPFEEFTALFPRAYQSHPHLESIYREFQHQRAIDTDDVKRNIASEVKRGQKYKREVARARRREDVGGIGEGAMQDVRMEAQLFGPSTHHPPGAPHTLETIGPAIERACEDVETENAALEATIAERLEQIKTIVGDLSDLRYGKFSKPAGGGPELGEDTKEALQRLERQCTDLGKG